MAGAPKVTGSAAVCDPARAKERASQAKRLQEAAAKDGNASNVTAFELSIFLRGSGPDQKTALTDAICGAAEQKIRLEFHPTAQKMIEKVAPGLLAAIESREAAPPPAPAPGPPAGPAAPAAPPPPPSAAAPRPPAALATGPMTLAELWRGLRDGLFSTAKPQWLVEQSKGGRRFGPPTLNFLKSRGFDPHFVDKLGGVVAAAEPPVDGPRPHDIPVDTSLSGVPPIAVSEGGEAGDPASRARHRMEAAEDALDVRHKPAETLRLLGEVASLDPSLAGKPDYQNLRKRAVQVQVRQLIVEAGLHMEMYDDPEAALKALEDAAALDPSLRRNKEYIDRLDFVRSATQERLRTREAARKKARDLVRRGDRLVGRNSQGALKLYEQAEQLLGIVGKDEEGRKAIVGKRADDLQKRLRLETEGAAAATGQTGRRGEGEREAFTADVKDFGGTSPVRPAPSGTSDHREAAVAVTGGGTVPVVEGGVLDADKINRVVAANAGAIRYLYSRSLTNPAVARLKRIACEVTINEKGTVTESKPEGEPPKGTEEFYQKACTLLAGWVFPASEGTTSVVISFDLQQGF